MTRFTLPLPPTTNTMYRGTGRRIYKTQETIAWEKEAFFIVKKTKSKPTKDPVYVGIELFLKRDRDIDNIKPILDSFQGKIIENDKQVVHLNIKKYVNKEEKHPRVEIVIERLLF